jgi:hypothetical protein
MESFGAHSNFDICSRAGHFLLKLAGSMEMLFSSCSSEITFIESKHNINFHFHRE